MPTDSSNTSLPSPPICFSDPSLYPDYFTCFSYTTSYLIFIAVSFSNTLLLPLYVLVLWVGFRRWRNPVASGTTSNSDVFTFCMVLTEIISILGYAFYSGAVVKCNETVVMIGYYCFITVFPMQTLFHCLSCVERYLAVVHPITYLGLRKVGGAVKTRNISIGCVCLLCFLTAGLAAWYFPDYPTTLFCVMLNFAIIVICFCSISVLCVLIRPGIRKEGGGRERADQSKQRALHSILIITVTLVMRSLGLTISNVIFSLNSLSKNKGCVMLMSGLWICLPSSVVLPLLFLYRLGALPCFSHKSNKDET